MTDLTLHRIPDDVHRALCAQAARHGRSTEAEIIIILQDNVRSQQHGEQSLARPVSELGKQALDGVSIVDAESRPLVERAVQSQESMEGQPNEQQAKGWATTMVNRIYRD